MADGLHGAALAFLLSGDLGAASIAPQSKVYDRKPKHPQFPSRATSVIQLFMTG